MINNKKIKPGIIYEPDDQNNLKIDSYTYKYSESKNLRRPGLIYNDEIFIPVNVNILNNIYKDRYFVSNYGNIYDYKTGYIINQIVDKNDYRIISAQVESETKYSKYKRFKVHRAVLGSFNPINDMGNKHVNHKHGKKDYNIVKLDENGNIIENETELEWSNIEKNNDHAIEMGLNKRTFSIEQAELVCQYLEKGFTDKEIADKLGYSYSDTNSEEYKKNCNIRRTIRKIRRRERYRNISNNYQDFPKSARETELLSNEVVEKICQYIIEGKTNKEIAMKFGYNKDIDNYEYTRFRRIISSIRNKKSYNNISNMYF